MATNLKGYNSSSDFNFLFYSIGKDVLYVRIFKNSKVFNKRWCSAFDYY